MKLRVIHLIRKLENIRRDREELDRMSSRIQEDRQYAPRVQDSLQEETTRLRQLEKKILAQVVKNPAVEMKQDANKGQKSIRQSTSRKQPSTREPELTIPVSKNDGSEKKIRSTTPPASGTTSSTSGTVKNPPKVKSSRAKTQEPSSSFQFRYRQS